MRRIGALDGLRGLAVLMVLAVHLELFHAITAPRALRALFWSGWSGVDLFFVLSGFLITGILVDAKGTADFFGRFYRRRALRIFPLYYSVCAALLVMVPLVPGNSWHAVYPTLKGWLSYGLFLQNWWMPRFEPDRRLIGHLWSLGVEEQFYLIWPACVFLFSRKQLKWACLLSLPLCLLLRIVLERRMPGFALMNTVTRLDTLLVGAFCAMVVREQKLAIAIKRWLPHTALAAFTGIVAIDLGAREIWTRGLYTSTIGFTCFALFYGVLLLWAYWQNGSGRLLDRLLGQSWLRQVGKYSYGIYVLHLPVFYGGKIMAARWSIAPFGLFYCGALLAFTFVLALISFEFFEKPLLGWRRETRTFRVRLPLAALKRSKAKSSDLAFDTAATLDETEFVQRPIHRR